MKNITLYAGSEAALVEKRDELRAKGVVVTDIVDNDWSKSIYFKDPTACRSSIVACCAVLPKMTRGCRSASPAGRGAEL